jgi:hypothetical protein
LIWDISQVLEENCDWLSFTLPPPLWTPSPVLQSAKRWGLNKIKEFEFEV